MRAIEIALTGLVGIVPPASVHEFQEVSVHFLKKAILRREGHSTFLERPGMCTISSLPNVEGLQRRTPMASPSRTCTVWSLISETLFLVICSQDPNLHLPTSSNIFQPPLSLVCPEASLLEISEAARTWALKSYFQSLIHLKSLWKGLRFIIC